MHAAYAAALSKFPDLRFGYTDRSLYYDMSVALPSFYKVKFRKGVELDLPAQKYAELFVEMVKEIKAK